MINELDKNMGIILACLYALLIYVIIMKCVCFY